MIPLINYLAEASIYAAVCYAAYWLIKGSASFSVLRLWLLGGLILSLGLPFIEWSLPSQISHYTVHLPVLTLSEIETQTVNNPFPWNYIQFLWAIYFGGLAIAGIRMMAGYYFLFQLIYQGEKRSAGQYELIYHPKVEIPFSFGRYVFWNPSWNYSAHQKEMILMHEKVHIQKGHSLDILFLQILKLIAWFHPLVYLFDKELKNIHEFQADMAALTTHKRKDYIELLMQHLFRAQWMPGHSIFQSPIQKRIRMMKKMRSKRTNKKMLILAVMLLASSIFYMACNKSMLKDESKRTERGLNSTETDQAYISSSPDVNEQEVMKTADQMPRFPGCEDVTDDAEREKCATNKMLQWVYERINYPVNAKENKVEGIAVVAFVVDKQGNIRDIDLIRDLGAGTGEEVVRVMREMKNMDQKWIPGEHNGKKVNVKLHLPVAFKLAE